jgi:hypothetical protein
MIKRILVLLIGLMAAFVPSAECQSSTDITWRIDSLATNRWFFVRRTKITLGNNDEVVGEQRSFFDSKAGVLAHANATLAQISADSAAQRATGAIEIDSARVRIQRAKTTPHTDASSVPRFSLAAPEELNVLPERTAKAPPKKPKATKPKKPKKPKP